MTRIHRPELDPNEPIPQPEGSVREMPSPPHIDPRLSPKAMKYQQQLHASKGGADVGLAPSVPIPRLDRFDDSKKGSTMAQQANSSGPLVPRIYPGDILPEEATQDPQFMTGQGDRIALNQPSLALKYGVIRKGEHVPGAFLVPQERRQQLRPETLEGIEKLNKLQPSAPEAVSAPVENLQHQVAETQASEAAAGAAARLGGRPIAGEKAPTPEDEKKLKEKDFSHLDTLDFGTIRQMMVRNLLNNEKQREIVEARLKVPISITEMLQNGFAKQTVSIIPGEFEPTFMTVGGDIELELKAMLAEEVRTFDYTDQYYLDKYSLMALTVGLYAINNDKLPSHLNDEGDFNRDRFLIKLKKVARMPLPMLASLGTHYFFFDIRCRKRFVASELGNG